MGASVWIEYIPWVYATIQGIVTIAVSIIGTKYVWNEFRLQNTTKQKMKLTVKSNHQTSLKATDNEMEKESVAKSEEFEVFTLP